MHAAITRTWTQGYGRQDQVRLIPPQPWPEEVSSLVCSQKRFQDPWRLSQVGTHVGSLGYVYTEKGCFISREASVYKYPQPLSSWQKKVWTCFLKPLTESVGVVQWLLDADFDAFLSEFL